MKDLKYLCAFTIPLSAFIGIYAGSYFTYLTPIFIFVFVPLIEPFSPASTKNIEEAKKPSFLNNKIYDWLLYMNLPIVFGILIYALFRITQIEYSIYEIIGIVFSVGIVLGANGINVAHELGHRFTNERFVAKALLLPSFYMHFYIEHNFGHHLKAATKEDPATAKLNQSLYSFWFTSVYNQYISSWKIQLNLLKKKERSFFDIKNDLLFYHLFTFIYLACIYTFFGSKGLLFSLAIGVIGFLLLETINYIEHYGLLRNKKESGRYERVQQKHSWNSNHTIGRILLFELTRHSDHHYKSSKKYQILDHHDQSPQLPFGYPTSMVISFFPPIWFRIINKLVPEEMKSIR